MFKVGDKILVVSNQGYSNCFPLGIHEIGSVSLDTTGSHIVGTTIELWSYYYDNKHNSISKYVPATNLTLLLWEGND